jgi:hypothetical protein
VIDLILDRLVRRLTLCLTFRRRGFRLGGRRRFRRRFAGGHLGSARHQNEPGRQRDIYLFDTATAAQGGSSARGANRKNFGAHGSHSHHGSQGTKPFRHFLRAIDLVDRVRRRGNGRCRRPKCLIRHADPNRERQPIQQRRRRNLIRADTFIERNQHCAGRTIDRGGKMSGDARTQALGHRQDQKTVF